jgi:hypothetical protein
MDVWFDSGSSWAGVLGGDDALNYPADLYLEASGGGSAASWQLPVPGTCPRPRPCLPS